MDLYENNLIRFNKEKTTKLAEKYRVILEDLGEDPNREGLLKTPERVAKAMQFFMQGYEQDPEKIISSAINLNNYKDKSDLIYFTLSEIVEIKVFL